MDCYSCGSKHGTPNWLNNYDNDGNRLCSRCAMRLIYNRIHGKKWSIINSHKKIIFRGKAVMLDKAPRRGLCERCGAVKGIDCKKTARHHWFYLTIIPWACTEELCTSCHMRHHRLLELKYGKSAFKQKGSLVYKGFIS